MENEKEIDSWEEKNNNIYAVNLKEVGLLLLKTLVVSIVLSAIIYGIVALFISKKTTGFEGLGIAFLGLVVYKLGVSIYVIVNIVKIVNECFYMHKKVIIYLLILVLSILIYLCFRTIFIPHIILLSATLILFIEGIASNSTKKSIILLLFIFIPLLGFRVSIFLLNRPSEEELAFRDLCKEYVASNDEYVYCKTYDNIKQINIKDKTTKNYGKYVGGYSTYLNNLYYHDTNNDKLYILDINSSVSKEVINLSKYHNFDINENVIKVLDENWDWKCYTHNIEKNNLKEKDCDNSFMYDEYVIKYKNYKIILKDSKLYIYDKLNSINDLEFTDNKYVDLSLDNDKLYLFSRDNENERINISYYDFDTKKLVETGLFYESGYCVGVKNNIVYYENNDNIYAYNLETGENEAITNNIFSYPVIDGNYLYYIERDENNYQNGLFRYNLETKEYESFEK